MGCTTERISGSIYNNPQDLETPILWKLSAVEAWWWLNLVEFCLLSVVEAKDRSAR